MSENNYLQRANMAVAAANEETKEIAEIQAKMILARNFPRDPRYCLDLIKMDCESKELAETAIYEFPRGDSVVRGASIRLVECVARHWGNLVAGIKELGTSGNTATVKAYCWDLQSNFYDEKIFDVELVRHTKKGSYELTDPRDRYEMMANMAARRKRACMQAVIPQNIIDEAIKACEDTLNDSIKKDDLETIKSKMVSAFKQIAEWITPEMIAGICGKEYEHISSRDIVKIRNLYNAIKDGFVKPENAFGREQTPEKPSVEEADSLNKLNDMLKGKTDEINE